MLRKIAFLLSLVTLMTACSSTKPIRTPNGIARAERIVLGGIPQYVLMRGQDVNNPVLLFLHGGPGGAATGLLRTYNEALEKHFTVIYWDQRGAGKSFSKTVRPEDIRVSLYRQDAHQLVQLLKQRFHQNKIVLVGHSWGSRLGMYLVNDHPEDFLAYVGIGQEVEAYRGEKQSYQYALEQARRTNNAKAIADLEAMGEPSSGNYHTMYKTGFWGIVKQKDWLLKLGGERYAKRHYRDWAMRIWKSREYSFGDVIRWVKGSGFSAGNAMNDPDFNNFSLFQQVPSVKIPVYFLSGQHDYNTPWPLVKQYCDSLQAPHKEFVLFDKSGHSPVFEEPDRFNQFLIDKLATRKIGSSAR